MLELWSDWLYQNLSILRQREKPLIFFLHFYAFQSNSRRLRHTFFWENFEHSSTKGNNYAAPDCDSSDSDLVCVCVCVCLSVCPAFTANISLTMGQILIKHCENVGTTVQLIVLKFKKQTDRQTDTDIRTDTHTHTQTNWSENITPPRFHRGVKNLVYLVSAITGYFVIDENNWTVLMVHSKKEIARWFFKRNNAQAIFR